MPKIIFEVEENSDVRLDLYLAEKLNISRSLIQKQIKDGKALINGETIKASYKPVLGDEINFEYEEATFSDLKPANIDIEIVYEDDDIIVVNKQKGLVVHPAPGNYDNTLVNALLYKCKSLSSINGYFRPGIVHRIDKDTSGLLVVAKNDKAHLFLAEQLKDKTCYRKYYALVKGVIEHNEVEINAPIGRNPKDRQKMCVTDLNSKEAISQFNVLERIDNATLLDVKLLTGRTHQIRVHMAYIHHPVINDGRYGGPIIDDRGQFLHAYYLSFIHPTSKERVEFKTKLPDYMIDYLKEKGVKDFERYL